MNKYSPEALNAVELTPKDIALAQQTLIEAALQVTMVGRIAGVLGGVVSAGRSMATEGVKPSNVVGLVVGAGVGYLAGKSSDAAVGGITLMRAEDKVDGAGNVINGLVNFGIGYGVASGARGLTRGFDKLTAKSETETIEIEYQAPVVVEE